MHSRKLNILLIEDNEDDYIIVRDLFSEIETTHFNLEWGPSYEEGVAALSALRPDAVLVDFHLAGHTGLDFLQEAQKRHCQIPIILLTGQGNRNVDLMAMRAGAADYEE